MLTVEIKGLKELQEALEALPQKVAEKGVKKALKAGSDPIRQAMVDTAPRNVGDIRFPEGFLADNIGTKIKLSHDQISGSAFIGPKGKIEYPAYASGAYRIVRKANGKAKKVGRIAVTIVAQWLEFGTSKMAKNPFLTMAFEGYKDSALQAIIDTLKEAVEDAAGK